MRLGALSSGAKGRSSLESLEALLAGRAAIFGTPLASPPLVTHRDTQTHRESLAVEPPGRTPPEGRSLPRRIHSFERPSRRAEGTLPGTHTPAQGGDHLALRNRLLLTFVSPTTSRTSCSSPALVNWKYTGLLALFFSTVTADPDLPSIENW